MILHVTQHQNKNMFSNLEKYQYINLILIIYLYSNINIIST